MRIRKLECFVVVLFLLLSHTQTVLAEVHAVRLEDPTESDQLFAPALEFFSSNEKTIRSAAAKFLNSGEKKIKIAYHTFRKNNEIEEIHVYNDSHDELFDEEYLALANCAKHLPIMSLTAYGEGADINFYYYYFDTSDFLRVHQCGYYYIPTVADKSAPLEEVLANCISERWMHELEIEDEYQIVRIADDFVYYHWHG